MRSPVASFQSRHRPLSKLGGRSPENKASFMDWKRYLERSTRRRLDRVADAAQLRYLL
jgi:hypothetical protein